MGACSSRDALGRTVLSPAQSPARGELPLHGASAFHRSNKSSLATTLSLHAQHEHQHLQCKDSSTNPHDAEDAEIDSFKAEELQENNSVSRDRTHTTSKAFPSSEDQVQSQSYSSDGDSIKQEKISTESHQDKQFMDDNAYDKDIMELHDMVYMDPTIERLKMLEKVKEKGKMIDGPNATRKYKSSLLDLFEKDDNFEMETYSGSESTYIIPENKKRSWGVNARGVSCVKKNTAELDTMQHQEFYSTETHLENADSSTYKHHDEETVGSADRLYIIAEKSETGALPALQLTRSSKTSAVQQEAKVHDSKHASVVRRDTRSRLTEETGEQIYDKSCIIVDTTACEKSNGIDTAQDRNIDHFKNRTSSMPTVEQRMFLSAPAIKTQTGEQIVSNFSDDKRKPGKIQCKNDNSTETEVTPLDKAMSSAQTFEEKHEGLGKCQHFGTTIHDYKTNNNCFAAKDGPVNALEFMADNHHAILNANSEVGTTEPLHDQQPVHAQQTTIDDLSSISSDFVSNAAEQTEPQSGKPSVSISTDQHLLSDGRNQIYYAAENNVVNFMGSTPERSHDESDENSRVEYSESALMREDNTSQFENIKGAATESSPVSNALVTNATGKEATAKQGMCSTEERADPETAKFDADANAYSSRGIKDAAEQMEDTTELNEQGFVMIGKKTNRDSDVISLVDSEEHGSEGNDQVNQESYSKKGEQNDYLSETPPARTETDALCSLARLKTLKEISEIQTNDTESVNHASYLDEKTVSLRGMSTKNSEEFAITPAFPSKTEDHERYEVKDHNKKSEDSEMFNHSGERTGESEIAETEQQCMKSEISSVTSALDNDSVREEGNPQRSKISISAPEKWHDQESDALCSVLKDQKEFTTFNSEDKHNLAAIHDQYVEHSELQNMTTSAKQSSSQLLMEEYHTAPDGIHGTTSRAEMLEEQPNAQEIATEAFKDKCSSLIGVGETKENGYQESCPSDACTDGNYHLKMVENEIAANIIVEKIASTQQIAMDTAAGNNQMNELCFCADGKELNAFDLSEQKNVKCVAESTVKLSDSSKTTETSEKQTECKSTALASTTLLLDAPHQGTEVPNQKNVSTVLKDQNSKDTGTIQDSGTDKEDHDTSKLNDTANMDSSPITISLVQEIQAIKELNRQGCNLVDESINKMPDPIDRTLQEDNEKISDELSIPPIKENFTEEKTPTPREETKAASAKIYSGNLLQLSETQINVAETEMPESIKGDEKTQDSNTLIIKSVERPAGSENAQKELKGVTVSLAIELDHAEEEAPIREKSNLLLTENQHGQLDSLSSFNFEDLTPEEQIQDRDAENPDSEHTKMNAEVIEGAEYQQNEQNFIITNKVTHTGSTATECVPEKSNQQINKESSSISSEHGIFKFEHSATKDKMYMVVTSKCSTDASTVPEIHVFGHKKEVQIQEQDQKTKSAVLELDQMTEEQLDGSTEEGSNACWVIQEESGETGEKKSDVALGSFMVDRTTGLLHVPEDPEQNIADSRLNLTSALEQEYRKDQHEELKEIKSSSLAMPCALASSSVEEDAKVQNQEDFSLVCLEETCEAFETKCSVIHKEDNKKILHAHGNTHSSAPIINHMELVKDIKELNELNPNEINSLEKKTRNQLNEEECSMLTEQNVTIPDSPTIKTESKISTSMCSSCPSKNSETQTSDAGHLMHNGMIANTKVNLPEDVHAKGNEMNALELAKQQNHDESNKNTGEDREIQLAAAIREGSEDIQEGECALTILSNVTSALRIDSAQQVPKVFISNISDSMYTEIEHGPSSNDSGNLSSDGSYLQFSNTVDIPKEVEVEPIQHRETENVALEVCESMQILPLEKSREAVKPNELFTINNKECDVHESIFNSNNSCLLAKIAPTMIEQSNEQGSILMHARRSSWSDTIEPQHVKTDDCHSIETSFMHGDERSGPSCTDPTVMAGIEEFTASADLQDLPAKFENKFEIPADNDKNTRFESKITETPAIKIDTAHEEEEAQIKQTLDSVTTENKQEQLDIILNCLPENEKDSPCYDITDQGKGVEDPLLEQIKMDKEFIEGRDYQDYMISHISKGAVFEETESLECLHEKISEQVKMQTFSTSIEQCAFLDEYLSPREKMENVITTTDLNGIHAESQIHASLQVEKIEIQEEDLRTYSSDVTVDNLELTAEIEKPLQQEACLLMGGSTNGSSQAIGTVQTESSEQRKNEPSDVLLEQCVRSDELLDACSNDQIEINNDADTELEETTVNGAAASLNASEGNQEHLETTYSFVMMEANNETNEVCIAAKDERVKNLVFSSEAGTYQAHAEYTDMPQIEEIIDSASTEIKHEQLDTILNSLQENKKDLRTNSILRIDSSQQELEVQAHKMSDATSAESQHELPDDTSDGLSNLLASNSVDNQKEIQDNCVQQPEKAFRELNACENFSQNLWENSHKIDNANAASSASKKTGEFTESVIYATSDSCLFVRNDTKMQEQREHSTEHVCILPDAPTGNNSGSLEEEQAKVDDQLSNQSSSISMKDMNIYSNNDSSASMEGQDIINSTLSGNVMKYSEIQVQKAENTVMETMYINTTNLLQTLEQEDSDAQVFGNTEHRAHETCNDENHGEWNVLGSTKKEEPMGSVSKDADKENDIKGCQAKSQAEESIIIGKTPSSFHRFKEEYRATGTQIFHGTEHKATNEICPHALTEKVNVLDSDVAKILEESEHEQVNHDGNSKNFTTANDVHVKDALKQVVEMGLQETLEVKDPNILIVNSLELVERMEEKGYEENPNQEARIATDVSTDKQPDAIDILQEEAIKRCNKEDTADKISPSSQYAVPRTEVETETENAGNTMLESFIVDQSNSVFHDSEANKIQLETVPALKLTKGQNETNQMCHSPKEKGASIPEFAPHQDCYTSDVDSTIEITKLAGIEECKQDQHEPGVKKEPTQEQNELLEGKEQSSLTTPDALVIDVAKGNAVGQHDEMFSLCASQECCEAPELSTEYTEYYETKELQAHENRDSSTVMMINAENMEEITELNKQNSMKLKILTNEESIATNVVQVVGKDQTGQEACMVSSQTAPFMHGLEDYKHTLSENKAKSETSLDAQNGGMKVSDTVKEKYHEKTDQDSSVWLLDSKELSGESEYLQMKIEKISIKSKPATHEALVETSSEDQHKPRDEDSNSGQEGDLPNLEPENSPNQHEENADTVNRRIDNEDVPFDPLEETSQRTPKIESSFIKNIPTCVTSTHAHVPVEFKNPEMPVEEKEQKNKKFTIVETALTNKGSFSHETSITSEEETLGSIAANEKKEQPVCKSATIPEVCEDEASMAAKYALSLNRVQARDGAGTGIKSIVTDDYISSSLLIDPTQANHPSIESVETEDTCQPKIRQVSTLDSTFRLTNESELKEDAKEQYMEQGCIISQSPMKLHMLAADEEYQESSAQCSTILKLESPATQKELSDENPVTQAESHEDNSFIFLTMPVEHLQVESGPDAENINISVYIQEEAPAPDVKCQNIAEPYVATEEASESNKCQKECSSNTINGTSDEIPAIKQETTKNAATPPHSRDTSEHEVEKSRKLMLQEVERMPASIVSAVKHKMKAQNSRKPCLLSKEDKYKTLIEEPLPAIEQKYNTAEFQGIESKEPVLQNAIVDTKEHVASINCEDESKVKAPDMILRNSEAHEKLTEKTNILYLEVPDIINADSTVNTTELIAAVNGLDSANLSRSISSSMIEVEQDAICCLLRTTTDSNIKYQADLSDDAQGMALCRSVGDPASPKVEYQFEEIEDANCKFEELKRRMVKQIPCNFSDFIEEKDSKMKVDKAMENQEVIDACVNRTLDLSERQDIQYSDSEMPTQMKYSSANAGNAENRSNALERRLIATIKDSHFVAAAQNATSNQVTENAKSISTEEGFVHAGKIPSPSSDTEYDKNSEPESKPVETRILLEPQRPRCKQADKCQIPTVIAEIYLDSIQKDMNSLRTKAHHKVNEDEPKKFSEAPTDNQCQITDDAVSVALEGSLIANTIISCKPNEMPSDTEYDKLEAEDTTVQTHKIRYANLATEGTSDDGVKH